MTIWGALLIPFIMIAILLLFFHHRTKWWEAGIPLAVSFMLIGGFKLMSENLGTKDMEVWNGWVLSAHYYEDWNQYIHRMCPVTTCSGSGQNTVCTTTLVDCSYVAYYPEYWAIKDSNGDTHRVNQKAYHHLVNLFEMQPQFVDMKRPYHTNDGDMYQILWPHTDKTVEPINVAHSYENRVQASRSVFNYQQINDNEASQLGLFSYPKVSLFNYPSILGNCGPNTQKANERLRFHNSMLGKAHQLRMWLLCTDSSDPVFGQLQESYWVGGNKNEVVVILGQGWTHVFSWTDNKTPLIEIRDFAVQNRDPLRVVDFMAEELQSGFVRKQFAEFSYLTVEPPLWAIILTYLITLAVNIGLSWFIIVNGFHDDDPRHDHPWNRLSLREAFGGQRPSNRTHHYSARPRRARNRSRRKRRP